MTTSRETEDLNHPVIRELVQRANSLSLQDRITLVKGLVPAIVKELKPREFEGLMVELKLKGERVYDALSHPGEGRKARNVMGERDVEGR
jgi:hypothetical protein